MQLAYDQFITRYRRFLIETAASITSEVAVFGDIPNMPMSPVQAEVWRRVENTELGDEMEFDHCEACAEEWREDIQRSIRLIDDYLAGNLGGIVRGVVAAYRSGQEGITIAIYDDGERVWVDEGIHEIAQEIRRFLKEKRFKPGQVISGEALPRRIGNFTLGSVSRVQMLFSSEV